MAHLTRVEDIHAAGRASAASRTPTPAEIEQITAILSPLRAQISERRAA